MTLFDEEEKERINPFDWHSKSTGFGQIMEKRGFDVVIGNPPYIDVKLIGEDLKAILKDKYVSASKRFDLYNLFIEKSVLLSARKGLLGFIIPSMFMRREYGKSLRDYLSKNTSFLKIIDFGTNQIFNKAMNYVSVIILSKSSLNNSVNIIQFNKTGLSSFEIKKAIEMKNTEGIKYFSLNQNQFRTDSEWFLHDETTNFLMKRFFSGFVAMNDILTFASEGIHSGKDEVFFVKSSFHKENNFENEITWPLAKGKDIHRYYPINSKTLEYYVIYPYDIKTGYVLNDKYLSKMTPNIMKHLVASKKLLSGRSYFNKSSKKWYELWCPRNPVLYTSQKIMAPEICNKGEFTLSLNPVFITDFHRPFKRHESKEPKRSAQGCHPARGLLSPYLASQSPRVLESWLVCES